MSFDNNFNRIFARRGVISFFIIVFLFFISILRVAVTATSNYAEVQNTQNSIKIIYSKQRKTIFDRNMKAITNKDSKIIACVSPTPRAITGISSVLKGEDLKIVLQKLKKGKPVICEVPEEIDCDGIACTTVFDHNSKDTCSIHLTGYTDSDMHGISGIEKAYDDILYTDKEIGFRYSSDGRGEILKGIKPEIMNDSSVNADGVVTTLDYKIQNIAEKYSKFLEAGAIVIAEPKSGKILASASSPYYDCTNIKEYLNKPDSPFLNRAISAYNVGSIFKPCIATAGIENGYKNFIYTCTGKAQIADRIFKCHKLQGHGIMNLKSAIANSCNTYFYNFAMNIGKENIYKAASSFNFGKSLKIGDNINTAKGNIPTISTLSNVAQLVNFSIGQGELLATPISMLTLYCSIAADGYYYIPSVIEGTIKNGNLTKYNNGSPTKVMSKETAKYLRECLGSVITEGTGKEAKPLTVTAGGKTATAQTGKFTDNEEISEGWFCGFFPLENPTYVVIAFSENIKKETMSTAKIFAGIADDVTALNNK